MVLEAKYTLSAEQFATLSSDPAYANDKVELVGGEVIVTMSNGLSSKIAGIIITYLNLYLFQHEIGHATGEHGGYRISATNVYAPDVGYIAKARLPVMPSEGFVPMPPDLAVEVISPSNTPTQIITKVTNYLAVGTVVWVVDIERRTVAIHTPTQMVEEIGQDGTIQGGALLPNFTLPVADIFRHL